MTAPLFPLHTLVVLSKALSRRLPKDPPPYLVAAEAAMAATATAAQEAMVVRLRETNKARLAADLALDNGLDGLWSLVRDRLLGWGRYQRPGLDFLLDDAELPVDFELVRDKAERAGELVVALFGEGAALDMLNKTFAEQSQLTANVLALIDSDGHEDALLELTGDELLPILRRGQVVYEAMVDRRAGDEAKSRADLRVLRGQLRRRMVRYANLVITLMEDDKPETQALVEAALLPMVVMRTMLGKKGAATGEGEGEGDSQPESEEEAELIAEIEAELATALDDPQQGSE